MSSAEEDSPATAAEGGGAAASGGAVLDGDIMQTLASGDLPQQLAGMTSALQEQLLSITQEMNKLKGELYSEQGGLAAKLNDLAERAALEVGGDADTSRPGSDGRPHASRTPASAAAHGAPGGEGASCCNRRGGASGSFAGSAVSSSAGSRAGLAAAEGYDSYGRAGSSERRPGGRHVDWAPGTRDLNREQRDRRRQQVAQNPGWTPYLIGLTLVTIGPLRPLLWELLKLIWASLRPMIFGDADEDGGPADDGLAWWDQEQGD